MPQNASQPAPDVSVMTLDGPDVAEQPIPRSRLTLRACPVTLAAIGSILDLLPIAGTPAAEFLVPVVVALTMITGGLTAVSDPALSRGTWVLYADGRELARGTVIL